MIKATILFGSQAVNEYGETGVIPADGDSDGYAGTVEFRTQAEMNAYLQGLSDANGWEKVLAFSPVYIRTPDCDKCKCWRDFFTDDDWTAHCPDCGKLLDEPLFGTVTLNGREFNVRVLDVEGELNGKTIGTENLNEMLLDEEGGYISEDARRLDEMICFYVPVDKIALPDNQLAEYINQHMK